MILIPTALQVLLEEGYSVSRKGFPTAVAETVFPVRPLTSALSYQPLKLHQRGNCMIRTIRIFYTNFTSES